MSKISVFLLLLSLSVFAETISIEDTYTPEQLQELVKKKERIKEQKALKEIATYSFELQQIESEISKEKVWMKSYASYLTSLDIRDKLLHITSRIKELKKRKKTIKSIDELNTLVSKEKILSTQIEKLKEKNSAPFSRLLTPPTVEEAPEISNPIDIFTGLSLIKTQSSDLKEYVDRKGKLIELIDLLRQERDIYEKIKILDLQKNGICH